MPGNHNSGRRPKPIALQVYEGRRKPGAGEEPQFPPGIPECPMWMPPIGREYWSHVVAELTAVPQLLRRVDRGVLEQLCKAYDRWCTFEWYCDANGWTYDYEQHYIDMNGTPAVKKYPRARPEARLAKDAGQEFDRLRGELGLSPSARVRLAVPQSVKRGSILDAD